MFMSMGDGWFVEITKEEGYTIRTVLKKITYRLQLDRGDKMNRKQ